MSKIFININISNININIYKYDVNYYFNFGQKYLITLTDFVLFEKESLE